jgi:hypothetical protein
VVLDEADYVPAALLVERMQYAQKWPAQHWRLAFQGNVRPWPEEDFALVEQAMAEVARQPIPTV